jgi:hypothetical protein
MDYVLKSPNRSAFMQAAYALGYATADVQGNLTLVETGTTQDAGNFFINDVGTVYEPTGNMLDGPMGPYPEQAAIPGYWVRIRVNNGRPIPAVPPGFTLYPPADENSAEDYVQPPYGQIA